MAPGRWRYTTHQGGVRVTVGQVTQTERPKLVTFEFSWNEEGIRSDQLKQLLDDIKDHLELEDIFETDGIVHVRFKVPGRFRGDDTHYDEFVDGYKQVVGHCIKVMHIECRVIDLRDKVSNIPPTDYIKWDATEAGYRVTVPGSASLPRDAMDSLMATIRSRGKVKGVRPVAMFTIIVTTKSGKPDKELVEGICKDIQQKAGNNLRASVLAQR